jgi:superfamily II RNA helicase
MVKVCSDTYVDNDTYQEYFDEFPYPLSSFQKYAIEGIVKGDHTLVTAHTGSGKTLPAEFAIQHFIRKGKKVIYTSPIKALSNQKYYEFTKKYPHISFGLFTGDIKTNPEADVLIMTTEILMNYLFKETNGFLKILPLSEETNQGTDLKDVAKLDVGSFNLNFQIDLQTELGCVVFDEVHYINDKERGQVWEKTILMLPEHIQMVMLSATIDNPKGFAQWIEDRYNGPESKQVYLASTNHRVVPLSHYGFITTTESIFKVVKDKDIQKQIRDHTNVLIDLQDAGGKFQDTGYLTVKKYTKMLEDNRVYINRKHTLNQLSLFLRDREMLPAIAFVFSRKNVEAMAKEVTIPLLEDDSKVPYTVRRDCEQILRKLPNYEEYLQLPEYLSLVSLLEKGIGIHHSGMIPVLREIVELMISKRYIKLLFATESFAIGLDCPIKTAIFTSLTKFDGQHERYLMAHEYTQMAGRAGRRGIDTVGHVVHCNNLFNVPTLTEYKTILGGVPQKLVSKFHISYGLVMNLLKNGVTDVNSICEFCSKSMVQGEIDDQSAGFQTKIAEMESKINVLRSNVSLLRSPVDACEKYLELDAKLSGLVNKKRKECEREMSILKDEHKHLLKDIGAVKQLLTSITDLESEKRESEYNKNWIRTNVVSICQVLGDAGFVECSEDKIELAEMGKVASCLAETHPLIMSRMMFDTNYFKSYSTVQLIGLFSCFTDVKIAAELRASIPKCQDEFLNNSIRKMGVWCESYEKIERESNLYTGIKYDELLMYDMVQYSMEWTGRSTEQECKYFIQATISEKGISVGDFTKAMMKIVTIAKELENVCETLEQIELLHKLRQIENLVLKYVLTSQSLYV